MTTNKATKILFVVPSLSTFIKKDLELLKRHYDTRILFYSGLKRVLLFLPKLLRGVLWADIAFCRFADNHAFLAILFARLFKRKSIVVVGGYEVARLPGLRYGLNRSRFFPRTVKFVLEKADRVLPVSEALKQEAVENVKVNGTNITVVPNGYDPIRFAPEGEKEPTVITVTEGSTRLRIQLKGLETFVRCASSLSEVKFLIIGIHGKALTQLQQVSQKNVSFIPPLNQERLIKFYRKAKVYCQLSQREGHPNALCEAMLCECVPVGTDTPGIRDVIEDTGFIVPSGDVEATTEAIRKALESDRGSTARERIRGLFTLEKREKKLVEIISHQFKQVEK